MFNSLIDSLSFFQVMFWLGTWLISSDQMVLIWILMRKWFVKEEEKWFRRFPRIKQKWHSEDLQGNQYKTIAELMTMNNHWIKVQRSHLHQYQQQQQQLDLSIINPAKQQRQHNHTSITFAPQPNHLKELLWDAHLQNQKHHRNHLRQVHLKGYLQENVC